MVSALSDDSTTFPLPEAIRQPLSRSWTIDESFAYCSALTRSHYENFPVGSILMPSSVQPAVHSLYAFMRTADDFSDEGRRPGDEKERMSYLQQWEAMLNACVEGNATHPIFIALRETLKRYDLPVQWLRDLLTAFKMDVTIRRYQTEEELMNYCRFSANPVGRLILTLFGYRSPELYGFSDSICTALQLANHWQDVAVDLTKDRIYLPADHLQNFGVTEASLFQWLQQPPDPSSNAWHNFQKLLSFEVTRAEGLFQNGFPLPLRVSGRLRTELKITWLGGYEILKRIRAVDFDVFRRRPALGKSDWLKLFGKAMIAYRL